MEAISDDITGKGKPVAVALATIYAHVKTVRKSGAYRSHYQISNLLRESAYRTRQSFQCGRYASRLEEHDIWHQPS